MYRVLVADDEPIERLVVRKKLKKYFSDQLEVIEAVNGREAVELFEKYQCHIALLDIEMPGINGLEAAEKIRKKNKGCSIVFLTAFDEFSYAKRAISVRALDYLLKPGSDEELAAVIEEAIRIAQAQEESGVDREEPAAERRIETGLENIRMKAVKEHIGAYIEEHYGGDLSLQDVAGAMNYSDAYFCKLFKQCFDKSFTSYLSEFRIAKAKELLADMGINIRDVSEKVGFHDSNYFAKVFKRMAGMTPSEYRLDVMQSAPRT